MKYLYLLYADESRTPSPGTPEMQGVLDAYGAYFQEISERGLIKGGDPIQPSSTAVTVRVRNGARILAGHDACHHDCTGALIHLYFHHHRGVSVVTFVGHAGHAPAAGHTGSPGARPG